MSDISSLSNEQLMGMLGGGGQPSPLSSMSNDELMAAYKASTPVAEDVIKSGGVGLAKGGIGLAGAGGDAGSLIQAGADKIAGQGTGQAILSALRSTPFGGLLNGPGSGTIQKAVESITGPFYKPQTVPGEYAQTIGEFVPAAIGPGGMAKKAVNVLAPALASETAGQLTKGSDLEPYARLGGAVAGGAGAAKAMQGMERMAAARSIPTAAELKSVASGAYDSARGLGVEIDPMATGLLGARIEGDLVRGGFRDYLAPKTFRALQELGAPAGKNATISDLDGVRRALGKAAGDPAEKAAATRAIESIDNYMASLSPGQVLRGDATRAGVLMSEARGNYAAAKRAETITDATTRAERQAGSAGSGGNIDNATRQQIKSILNNPKKSRGFSAEELDAMEQLVRGTTVGNLARLTGKLAPTGIVSGALSSGAGFAAGGPAGAVALPLAGYAGKAIGDASTRRQLQNLDAMIRSRAPLSSARAGSASLNPAMLPQFQRSLLNAALSQGGFVLPPLFPQRQSAF